MHARTCTTGSNVWARQRPVVAVGMEVMSAPVHHYQVCFCCNVEHMFEYCCHSGQLTVSEEQFAVYDPIPPGTAYFTAPVRS